MHLVTSSYFWSHKKDGGHAIQSAVGENPMLHAHFTAVCVIDAELLTMKFLNPRKRICPDTHPLLEYLLWTCFSLVTLTLIR